LRIVEKSYRWNRSTEGHSASLDGNQLLLERLMCVCGCKEHLIVDDGYTYCHTCEQSTQDAHLAQPGEFISVKNNSIILVHKTSGQERAATCACGAVLTSNTITYRFGHLATRKLRRTIVAACDPGTKQFRVLFRCDGKDYFSEYRSCVIPKGFSANGAMLPLTFGESKPGEEGEFILPLKRLVNPDERTEKILLDSNLHGPQVFADSIRNLLRRAVDDEPVRNDLSVADKNVVVATAYPCIFDGKQKSVFLTALRGSLSPGTRIIAFPEPVAAFFSLSDKRQFIPGVYIVIDVGATTLDGAVVCVTHDNRILVLSTFGCDIGVGAMSAIILTTPTAHRSP
jgi:hypothetical protein